jgi:hypothetical protein
MLPRLRSAVVRFDALPEPVMRVLFLALPVDARARAACVCRSWRVFLADTSLWLHLDLTPAGGVAAAHVTENLVRGAVARAAGQMRVLCLEDERTRHKVDLLLDVIKSDGAELQHVNTNVRFKVEELRVVLAAAPRLQVLSAQFFGGCTELLPVLRNDPPYGPLRIRELTVQFDGNLLADDDVLALAAAVERHESLRRLTVVYLRFARGLNALVDAAAERRVSLLSLLHCSTDADSVPALARLLQRGSLTKLQVIPHGSGFPHANEELPALCAALRACHTLTQLELPFSPPAGANRRALVELLDAVAALPALTELNLNWSRFLDFADAGHALGALLSANLPSLRTLSVTGCNLGDEGLALLLDGLAANTHLRKLDCPLNDPSEAFKRNRLDPTLAALAARARFDA